MAPKASATATLSMSTEERVRKLIASERWNRQVERAVKGFESGEEAFSLRDLGLE